MKCPICHEQVQVELALDSEGFHESIYECSNCQASWSVQHNLVDMIKDPQSRTFLEVQSLAVEEDDFSWAV